ncbi:MAG: hypothetical protein JSW33_00220 [bacterium]|nr:MAG: hypothetical protein JSW33_00220 [bacterium]
MTRFRLFSLLVLLFIIAPTFSQIPRQMNYQGYLTDNNNNPVTGNLMLRFTIYDALVSGTNLWYEEHPNVALIDGVFRVVLGNTNPLDLPFDKPYWLGIRVGNDPEMQPRVALSSVGYSLNSLRAEGVKDSSVTTESIQNGAITLPKLEPDVMIKVWEGTISGLPTYQITGLNGNLHKFYKIFFSGRLHNTDTYLLVRPNGDDVNGNYRSLMNHNGDAGGWTWAYTGMYMGRSAWGECDLSFEFTLACETGRFRFSHGEGIMALLTNYHILALDAWCKWWNNTDNVTSLEITSTNSSGLTTGTFSGTVVVYAIVPR